MPGPLKVRRVLLPGAARRSHRIRRAQPDVFAGRRRRPRQAGSRSCTSRTTCTRFLAPAATSRCRSASRAPCSSTPAWPEPARRSLRRSRRFPQTDPRHRQYAPAPGSHRRQPGALDARRLRQRRNDRRRTPRRDHLLPRERAAADERRARQREAPRYRAVAGEHLLQRGEKSFTSTARRSSCSISPMRTPTAT